MTDHCNGQTFAIAGTTFRCWVTDNGQRYEWRSTCGRFRIGRRGYVVIEHEDDKELITHHFAIVDGRTIGTEFASLRQAMLKALTTTERRRAA